MTRVMRRWALMLALGASAPGQAQRANFTWEIPKTASVVDVPGSVDANGVPVKLRAVRSKEKPEVIVKHVVERFLSWGFVVPPGQQQPQLMREPMVTALDTRNFISYTAIIQVNPDNTTTVILGEANLGAAKPPASSDLPVFPGAGKALTAETEGSRTLSYTVPNKTSAEVEAFYRAELGKRGYREVQPHLFRSATEELQLHMGVTKDGPLAVRLVRRAAVPDDGLSPGK